MGSSMKIGNLPNIYFGNTIGTLIACMVSVFIVFQYLEGRYSRTYHNKWIYIFLQVVCCILNFFIVMLDIAAVSLITWLTVISLLGGIFYYSVELKRSKCYLINIVFILTISICESIGIMMVEGAVHLTNAEVSEPILDFSQNIAGAIVAMFLYYMVLIRLFRISKASKITFSQYMIYATVTIYVLINIGGLLFLEKNDTNGDSYLFFMIDLILLVFINLYFFYVLDTFAENKDLKYHIELYEAQAKSNYYYYVKQEENYRTALTVIHDVRKHIRVMESLSKEGDTQKIQNYAGLLENVLLPLVKIRYCDNAILNVIINDKKEYCEKKGINLDVSINKLNLNFMADIDITTIYGNILDNAIEACEKAYNRCIILNIYPFNDFVYTQLSNTFDGKIEKDIKKKLISQKGVGHGIGLKNVESVIKKYNGEMQYSNEGEWFTIELMFNQS